MTGTRQTIQYSLALELGDQSGPSGRAMASGAIAPHPPFAISAGIGAIGWTSALPDFLAGDARASKAIICRLHWTLRLFQSLPDGKLGDRGLSSSITGCHSSEPRITAWT